MTDILYLAQPYSHPDGNIRHHRFKMACMASAELIRQGHIVYSPIAHSHTICEHSPGIDSSWQTWQPQCIAMLDACTKLLVLQLDGWKESVGLHAEIKHAKQTGKPIAYIGHGELVASNSKDLVRKAFKSTQQ